MFLIYPQMLGFRMRRQSVTTTMPFFVLTQRAMSSLRKSGRFQAGSKYPPFFSKLNTANINITGIGAYKDYIKFGECFQVGTL